MVFHESPPVRCPKLKVFMEGKCKLRFDHEIQIVLNKPYFGIRELVITSLFEEDQPVWGKGVIEDTSYLIKITDKILLALKFDFTQKYSASKSIIKSHY